MSVFLHPPTFLPVKSSAEGPAGVPPRENEKLHTPVGTWLRHRCKTISRLPRRPGGCLGGYERVNTCGLFPSLQVEKIPFPPGKDK